MKRTYTFAAAGGIYYLALLLSVVFQFAKRSEFYSLSVIQYFFVPVAAFFFFALLSKIKISLPSLIYYLVLFFCVVSFHINYSYPLTSALNNYNAFLVVKIDGDPLGAKSRALYKEIKKEVKRKDLIYYLPAKLNIKKIQKLRKLNAAAGSLRWLFFLAPALGVKDKVSSFNELYLVQEVSGTGLTFNPMPDTAKYISLIINGALEKDPLSLKRAALRRAFWSSWAHLSFAWWKVGNFYFTKFLNTKEKGYLKCARNAYSLALGLLKQDDNNELLSALYNNLALSEYALYPHKKQKKKKVLRLLKKAKKSLKGKMLFPYATRSIVRGTVENNIAVLKQIIGKRKRRKFNGVRRDSKKTA